MVKLFQSLVQLQEKFILILIHTTHNHILFAICLDVWPGPRALSYYIIWMEGELNSCPEILIN